MMFVKLKTSTIQYAIKSHKICQALALMYLPVQIMIGERVNILYTPMHTEATLIGLKVLINFL